MTAEWTILKLLDWTTSYFTEHGVPSPRLDAELLLGEVLNLKRINLYLNFENPVSPADLARFKAMIQRRAKREPLQYIMGHMDFFGRRFVVTPDVLIPRPETEQLVVRALEWLDAHPKATRVLDVGTGTGCIAITLALERPPLQVTAVDVSEAAIAITLENSGQLSAVVTTQLTPAHDEEKTGRGDAEGLFPSRAPVPNPAVRPSSSCERAKHPSVAGPLPVCDRGILAGFDLIISNPPYIPTAEVAALQPEVAQYEPRLALDGGKDGLDFYRQLLQDAPQWLSPRGALALEMGAGQGDAISNIATTIGKWQTPSRYSDLSGVERIMIFGLKD